MPYPIKNRQVQISVVLAHPGLHKPKKEKKDADEKVKVRAYQSLVSLYLSEIEQGSVGRNKVNQNWIFSINQEL